MLSERLPEFLEGRFANDDRAGTVMNFCSFKCSLEELPGKAEALTRVLKKFVDDFKVTTSHCTSYFSSEDACDRVNVTFYGCGPSDKCEWSYWTIVPKNKETGRAELWAMHITDKYGGERAGMPWLTASTVDDLLDMLRFVIMTYHTAEERKNWGFGI